MEGKAFISKTKVIRGDEFAGRLPESRGKLLRVSRGLKEKERERNNVMVMTVGAQSVESRPSRHLADDGTVALAWKTDDEILQITNPA